MATKVENPIDSVRALSILNSRLPISKEHVNKQVFLSIQGNATFISAKEQELKTPNQKNYFDKYIYNCKANSTEAMSRRSNKMLHAAALMQESAGNVDAAHELFNEYLNNIQVSFNAIVRTGVYKFENGDMVTAVVGEAETKDGYTAIVINDVKYKAPVTIEKKKFSVTDLIGEEAFTPEELSALVKS